MTDIMPVNADDRQELLNIFRKEIPGCDEAYELSRFLDYLRSIDKQWEGNEAALKKSMLFNYLQDYIGEHKPFRAGRD